MKKKHEEIFGKIIETRNDVWFRGKEGKLFIDDICRHCGESAGVFPGTTTERRSPLEYSGNPGAFEKKINIKEKICYL